MAIFSAKPIRVLRPVPTAVPPAASIYNRGSVSFTRAIPFSTCNNQRINIFLFANSIYCFDAFFSVIKKFKNCPLKLKNCRNHCLNKIGINT